MARFGTSAPRGSKTFTRGRSVLRAALGVCVIGLLLAFSAPTASLAAEKITTPVIAKAVEWADANGASSWVSTGEAAAGEAVTFRLTGTLPSDWDKFTNYFYEFDDAPDKALVVDTSSVTVELTDEEGTKKQDLTSAFVVAGPASAGSTWTASCDDLKAAASNAVASDRVVLTYTATLDPALATPGLDNEKTNVSYLRYSSKPYNNVIGQSKEAEAHVVTWGLDLNKVDSNDANKTLSGAAFTIQGEDGRYVQADGSLGASVYEFESDSDGRVSVTGLASGFYTVAETRAPEGYNMLSAPFRVQLSADLSSDNPGLTVTIPESNASMQVDAYAGVASVRVPNVRSGGGSQGTNPTFTKMPQTGDPSFSAPVALMGCLGAACVAVALLIRRAGRIG